MKGIIRLNLIITVIIALFAISATLSPKPDKKKTKEKKETPMESVILRDTSNCANYYDAKAIVKIVPHTDSCPPNCQEVHIQSIIVEKTLKTCPKGKLYNPRKLACDFPENVVTCHHTPKCTNE